MTEIIKYQSSSGEITLSPGIIRKYLVAGQGNVTDKEIMMFLALCKYQKLNPFLREVYLIKYGTETATMVTGKETFLKRAMKNEKYAGHETGMSTDGKKAWAKIHLHGYKVPIMCEVDYSEYVGLKKDGTPNRMWKSKPRTMLKKVALVQALREAFPDDLGGMYSQEEINTIDQPLPIDEVIVDAEIVPQTEKKQLTPEQSKLWAALTIFCDSNPEKVKATLKEMTSFKVTKGEDKGKVVQGKDSIYDVSDKQAQTVRHEIEKLQKKQKENSSNLDAPEKCKICAEFDKCELDPDPECKSFIPLEKTTQEPL
jgi:phage recombination protein Bet